MQIAGRSPASHPTNPLVNKQSESAAIRQPLPWLLTLLLIYSDFRRPSAGLAQGGGGHGWPQSAEAQDGPYSAVLPEQDRSEGTRSAAEGRMWEPAVFGYFFPRKKLTRRKGHPFQGLCIFLNFSLA
ncbi:hypothetical protein J3B00_000560 [Pseudomonas sp. BP8]|nr:hypothetical protein [Pseudomonas sp. BP8]